MPASFLSGPPNLQPMLSGVLYGFAAALMQSISYVFSAQFILQHRATPLTLLILMHLVLGGVCLLILPLLWHPKLLSVGDYILPLLSTTFFYCVGQISLFKAIRVSEASRVSPLLGLKVLVLAAMGLLWFGDSYQWVQWLAIGLCALGAIWLSASGGRISVSALGWVVMACVGYALSDLSILYTMHSLEPLSLIHAAAVGVCLCYMICGVLSLLFYPGLKDKQLLAQSAPSALTWLLAMVFLFACFAEIGVVFGGIVQSSRGLISIFLGVFLTWVGFKYAEKMPARSVFMQRFAASTLMLFAIAMFSLGAEG